jgi:hypothetical protein
MHKPACRCPRCSQSTEAFEVMGFAPSSAPGRNGSGAGEAGAYEAEGEGEYEGESQYEGPYQGEYESEGEGEGEYEGEAEWGGEYEGPFSEAEEIALATELLSVSSEAELDQFLGKFLKKAGRFIGRVAKPFGSVLKAVAKKALPFVGGALGSLIPIPGVGTAVGTALGGALSKALEMEFSGLELEDREFEMARRFVRVAGTAAQQIGQAAATTDPQAAVQSAVAAAAQRHLRHFQSSAARDASPRMSGRWIRRGGTLIVVGA